MESLQGKHSKDTDLHEQMPQTDIETEMAGQSAELGTMEESQVGAYGCANKKEEVALGGSHTAKGSPKCYTPSA